MNNIDYIKEQILDIIKNSPFAVLATESGGQPHASLIAITPFLSYKQIIFATYRNSLKYRNIQNNSRVALFFDRSFFKNEVHKERCVLTILGNIIEISSTNKESAYLTHLRRHPEMESFMRSQDCTILIIIAQSFQIVNGIDNVKWVTSEDLD